MQWHEVNCIAKRSSQGPTFGEQWGTSTWKEVLKNSPELQSEVFLMQKSLSVWLTSDLLPVSNFISRSDHWNLTMMWNEQHQMAMLVRNNTRSGWSWRNGQCVLSVVRCCMMDRSLVSSQTPQQCETTTCSLLQTFRPHLAKKNYSASYWTKHSALSSVVSRGTKTSAGGMKRKKNACVFWMVSLCHFRNVTFFWFVELICLETCKQNEPSCNHHLHCQNKEQRTNPTHAASQWTWTAEPVSAIDGALLGLLQRSKGALLGASLVGVHSRRMN